MPPALSLARPLQARWQAAPANLRGALLMLAAFAGFAGMIAAIKAIGTAIPLAQLLVIRQLVMTLFLMPLFLGDLTAALSTRNLRLQIFRGLCSLGAMGCGFTALRHVPLADVTALGFAQVLFVTLLAVLVLKEKVGLAHWAAICIGFLGVLVMLRPGAGGLDPFALLAVAGALFGAGITISVRILAQSERTSTILLYQAVTLMAALTLPALWLWQWPSPREWALMGLVGLFGTIGQFLITRAYQLGEAAALAPLEFARLPIAALLGYLLFTEVPTPATLAGAALVIGAISWTLHHNRRRG